MPKMRYRPEENVSKLREADVQWRRHYNGVGSHSALGYRPPAPETIAFPVMGLPYHYHGNPMETPGGILH